MKRPFTGLSANDPEQIKPARNKLARLATRIRTKVSKHLHQPVFPHLRWQVQHYLEQRIWFILPPRKPEAGQKLVLPFRLARLLHQQARKIDQPADALLPELLRTALLERQPSDPVELAWLGLTEREREVACLMVAGLTNRQIAARLTISRTTVRTHARRIVRKFGCPNRNSLPDLQPYCPEQE